MRHPATDNSNEMARSDKGRHLCVAMELPSMFATTDLSVVYSCWLRNLNHADEFLADLLYLCALRSSGLRMH